MKRIASFSSFDLGNPKPDNQAKKCCSPDFFEFSQYFVSIDFGSYFFLVVQGELAFGPKGRPASAGKPRIPGNAEVVFEVEVVGLPGKEPELIELIGDE